MSQGRLDRNERHNQAGEWSDPAIEGRRRNDTHMSFPTAQGRHQRNIPPSALPHQKIGSLQIGVVKGQDLHMRSHLHRMFQ